MTLAARLRVRMAAGDARGTVFLPGDDIDGVEDMRGTPAAVLFAITDRAEPGVLLTRRTETLRAHAGQVALPGGRIDPGDDGPVAAALREAEEEIGLPRHLADVVGIADRYRTVTGYDVTPVVAVVPPDLPLVPQEAEVAKLFEVPLAFLLAPENHTPRTMIWRGRERTIYEMTWDDNRIWGATAAMIVNLARRLAE
ncbi:CoA pyrophosphatase [Sphingomonas prati]|uniref:8-oxo-dGTP pyrophosphatase MutT (NUDIX family) n=1 Tax=Sphingomonas prati TaxID=1843237 RepID=A0A7W9BQ45_9SPHN|nr:CoA pyrophosphatase [Sphingomonas prati]MBB5727899.1 8-oxo-dGTP pyrophosphatase MutT (NUDIX family) [Sphingomonas prati]